MTNTTENIHATNGRLGAGAKSPEGLGLSAQTFCLLHNEDSSVLQKLKTNLMSSLTPHNALELIHVEKIVESTWLLYRVADLETKILAAEIESQRAQRTGQFKNLDDPTQFEIREANLTFFALEALPRNAEPDFPEPRALPHHARAQSPPRPRHPHENARRRHLARH